MWPAKSIYAARATHQIQKVLKTNRHFCCIRQLLWPADPFFLNLWPAEHLFLLMRLSSGFEFETPDIKRAKMMEFIAFYSCLSFSAFPQWALDQPSCPAKVFLLVASVATIPRHLGLQAARLSPPLSRERLPGLVPTRLGHVGQVLIKTWLLYPFI